MKIIFINRFFYPDHSATSQILSDLAFYLAEKGSDIHVITSRQLYDNPLASLKKYDVVKGVEIHRVWSATFGRQNFFGRFLDYLSFYLSAFIKLLFISKKNDVLVAKTDPPLLSVMAAVAAKMRGARLVTWLQDLFPEVAEVVGVKGVSGFLAKALKDLRNSSLKAATINVVIGEGMAKKLMAEGIQPDKIRVIHNWSDGNIIRPKPVSESRLRREWGLDDKFVVAYSGNMGRAHQFDAILNVAQFLKEEAHFHFLMIGGGSQKKHLEQEKERVGLQNLSFKGYQPYELLGESLAVAHVHLISLKPELEGLIVPSKFYGILAAGRPCLYLGDPQGELARIIDNEKCGLVIKEGSGGELADAIRYLADNPDECIDMGNRARRLFDRRYDKPIAMRSWEAVFDGLNQKL